MELLYDVEEALLSTFNLDIGERLSWQQELEA